MTYDDVWWRRPVSSPLSMSLTTTASRKWNSAFEIQNWSKLKDRAQRVDKRDGVIRLVMFNPRVKVIKMSKIVDFMYFLLDRTKYQFQFGQDI